MHQRIVEIDAVVRRDCIATLVLITAMATVFASGCSGDSPTKDNDVNAAPITVANANSMQQAVVGTAFAYDATKGGTVFSNPRGSALTYAVNFAPSANGLQATNGLIAGTPVVPGTVTATITVTDNAGRTASDVFAITVGSMPVTVQSPNANQVAVVGNAFSYDATKGGTAFRDPHSSGLSYAVTFVPAASGLAATGGVITGKPTTVGTINVTIVATDAFGQSASNAFEVAMQEVVTHVPQLPVTAHAYAGPGAPIPAHFNVGPGNVVGADNTPANNAITNAGATLGRVLFYDRRVSRTGTVSCASCHQQQFGFADTARFSKGFAGAPTGRHSMALANARWYQPGRFFWDERAATLEAQVLLPMQDAGEMGMTLPDVVTRLSATSFYAPLFEAAFGTRDITSERVSRALAQFIRAMVSGRSKYDQAFTAGGPPNFAATFTAEELLGQQLYEGRAGCVRCHGTVAHVAPAALNNGLDAVLSDQGAGQGRFKAPSLRNVGVRGRFMHDGRFASLEEVIEFYNSGVQNNPGLDPRLRTPNGQPQRLNLTAQEKTALAAFLHTLTDMQFLLDVRFSNPFQGQ